jgi:hypothetical protein
MHSELAKERSRRQGAACVRCGARVSPPSCSPSMQPPTRRELVLVAALAVFLVLFTEWRYVPPVPPVPAPSYSETRAAAVTPLNYTPADALSLPAKIPSAQLEWGLGPVPETTLVGHVPGVHSPACHTVMSADLYAQAGRSSTGCTCGTAPSSSSPMRPRSSRTGSG